MFDVITVAPAGALAVSIKVDCAGRCGLIGFHALAATSAKAAGLSRRATLWTVHRVLLLCLSLTVVTHQDSSLCSQPWALRRYRFAVLKDSITAYCPMLPVSCPSGIVGPRAASVSQPGTYRPAPSLPLRYMPSSSWRLPGCPPARRARGPSSKGPVDRSRGDRGIVAEHHAHRRTGRRRYNSRQFPARFRVARGNNHVAPLLQSGRWLRPDGSGCGRCGPADNARQLLPGRCQWRAETARGPDRARRGFDELIRGCNAPTNRVD